MPVIKTEVVQLRGPTDVLVVRQVVRTLAEELGFSLVEQTKMVTAGSELARNTVDYGGGGTARIQAIVEPPRKGICMVFEDQGPGIPDIEQAMRDGFSSGSGLGLGLGGARRLMHEFEIHSKAGEGTRVRVARWR
jgi:serine/threonine-protein kinase RsbT